MSEIKNASILVQASNQLTNHQVALLAVSAQLTLVFIITGVKQSLGRSVLG